MIILIILKVFITIYSNVLQYNGEYDKALNFLNNGLINNNNSILLISERANIYLK